MVVWVQFLVLRLLNGCSLSPIALVFELGPGLASCFEDSGIISVFLPTLCRFSL
jgi:hypothetical protein